MVRVAQRSRARVSVPGGLDVDDEPEVLRELAGDRAALEALLGRHQPFVHDLAFRMVMTRQDAEMLGTTRDAYRKLVSRARARLAEAIRGRCGLLDPSGSCRCSNKVSGLVRPGAYGKRPLTFVDERAPRLGEVIGEKLDTFNREIYPEYARIVREQPFCPAPALDAWLRQLIETPELESVFDAG